MHASTLEAYNIHAADFAGRYRAGSGRDLWPFPAECEVLDLGCGSGVELAALVRAGYRADGLDGSSAMLDTARDTLKTAGCYFSGKLIHDSLPELAKVADAAYDAANCAAVLQHLPREQLFDVAYNLRRILRPNGHLLVSIPVPTSEDAEIHSDGRLFNNVTAAELQLLLERVGFSIVSTQTTADSLGRSDRQWTTLLLQLPGGNTQKPLDTIESILNRDKKDATYKLALFRALADVAQTDHRCAHWLPDGTVRVSTAVLAEKWLQYYWPLFESESFIPQKRGEKPSSTKPIAFRSGLSTLIDAWRQQGGLTGYLLASRADRLAADQRKLEKAAISKLRSTIWNMPVRYAGEGEFSIFQYDPQSKCVLIPPEIWRELSLAGSWIADACVLRWAELTHDIDRSVAVSQVVEALLARPLPDRQVTAARNVFLDLETIECAWSGRSVSRATLEVDHAIPYSLWHNNDLWNLFPAARLVNNDKRDKLPERDVLLARRDVMIHYWSILQDAHPIQFDREASRLVGRRLDANWQTPLFQAFAESVEVTAVQRGIPRWRPDVQIPAATHSRNTRAAASNPIPIWTPMFLEGDVAARQYRDALPFVGELTAGTSLFFGFELTNLDHAASWLATPEAVARKRRFVVEIVGDSMAPTVNVGDYVVCEYHRAARHDGQVVIFARGDADDVAELALKRIRKGAAGLEFHSDNPAYEPIVSEVRDADTGHQQILGVAIYNLTKGQPVR